MLYIFHSVLITYLIVCLELHEMGGSEELGSLREIHDGLG